MKPVMEKPKLSPELLEHVMKMCKYYYTLSILLGTPVHMFIYAVI
ncbi:MAG: hypothetical protein ACRCVL_00630 [Cetobacterium sp.]